MNKVQALCWTLPLWIGTGWAAEPADLLDLGLEELLQIRVDVTGTRLLRDPSRSSGPLTSYSRAEIEASGAQTIGDFLQSLPANGSVLNNNGSSGTAHGTASVNLRNLGENRTLVLLNGRRLANGTATRGFRDFVDLNILPLALVERIEVLGAGASAIYGADAIAGVVNLISRGEFTGTAMHASGGLSTHGDGEQQRVELLSGRQGERWGLWGGVTMQDYEPIFVDDRAFSAVPLGALSSTTPQGRYVIPGLGTITLRDGARGDAIGDFRPFNLAEDGNNPFAGTYLRYPSEQRALFAEGFVQIGRIRWFAELLVSQRRSQQNFSAASTGVSSADGFRMPANHPFNPFGIDLVRGFSASRNLDPLGRRVNRQIVNSNRLLFGAQGRWWRDWDWEVAASAAQNRGRFLAFNQLHRDRLALAIGAPEACAAVPGCLPVPLFGSFEQFTPAMLDWLRVDGRDRNDVEQFSLQANTRGELWQLPAGPLQLAAGVEWRHERGSDRPDPVISGTAQYINAAPTSGQVRDGTEGSYRVAEAFVELHAALWQSREGALLQANVAARHSRYDSFGNKTTGSAGLWFAPSERWSFRANAAQTFRAPSILELFEGGRITNLPGRDPCVGGPALPGCAGVPSHYVQSGSQITSLVAGNSALQPETSQQFSLGARWQFAKDWALAADAYRIRIDDLVLSFDSQQILDDCAYSGRRCELIQRSADTGRIILLSVQRDNAGQRRVEGVDLELTGRHGRWTLRGQASYLHRFEDVDHIGGATRTDDAAGSQRLRASYPRWRALASLDWQHAGWLASWRWRYLHGMREASDHPHIAATHYHDLRLQRQFGAQLQAYVGIVNVFDREPPLSRVNANINFDIASYDARGRVAYLGLEWRW